MSHQKLDIFREFLGYLFVIILAIIFSVLVRIFVFETYVVPTPSMEPTLLVEDKVIVNKLAYKFHPIKRGDIVAFHSPVEKGKDLVKRAIALGGDKITLTSQGDIYINDKKLVEDYLPDNINPGYDPQTFIIGEDEIFVMGDNRNDSLDSRFFGPINKKDIFGEVFIIYWPPSRFGKPNH